MKEEVALMAHICGICVEDIRGMDSQDYNRLQEQLLRFRGVSV
ncbi:MAG: phage tail assembly protein [Desulfovibrio sp.]|nr:phage tail assembly protein [Desulfovibrio sp.]